MPTVLIGATVNNVPNFMPVAFIGIVTFKPVVVACGMSPTHHTSSGISANGTFSINLRSTLDQPSIILITSDDVQGKHSRFRPPLEGYLTSLYPEGTVKSDEGIEETSILFTSEYKSKRTFPPF